MVVLSLKIVINLPMTSESFAVKENHIGVAVRENLLYRHTDRLLDILLVLYKDVNCTKVELTYMKF